MKYKILEADVPNKNGRIYPRALLDKIVEQFKTPEIGHLGVQDDARIHFVHASHQVMSLEIQDNALYAEIVPLVTHKGDLLRKMMEEGTVAFRPSGIGGCTVDKDGNQVVEDSYVMVCVNALPEDEAA